MEKLNFTVNVKATKILPAYYNPTEEKYVTLKPTAKGGINKSSSGTLPHILGKIQFYGEQINVLDKNQRVGETEEQSLAFHNQVEKASNYFYKSKSEFEVPEDFIALIGTSDDFTFGIIGSEELIIRDITKDGNMTSAYRTAITIWAGQYNVVSLVPNDNAKIIRKLINNEYLPIDLYSTVVKPKKGEKTKTKRVKTEALLPGMDNLIRKAFFFGLTSGSMVMHHAGGHPDKKRPGDSTKSGFLRVNENDHRIYMTPLDPIKMMKDEEKKIEQREVSKSKKATTTNTKNRGNKVKSSANLNAFKNRRAGKEENQDFFYREEKKGKREQVEQEEYDDTELEEQAFDADQFAGETITNFDETNQYDDETLVETSSSKSKVDKDRYEEQVEEDITEVDNYVIPDSVNKYDINAMEVRDFESKMRDGATSPIVMFGPDLRFEDGKAYVTKYDIQGKRGYHEVNIHGDYHTKEQQEMLKNQLYKMQNNAVASMEYLIAYQNDPDFQKLPKHVQKEINDRKKREYYEIIEPKLYEISLRKYNEYKEKFEKGEIDKNEKFKLDNKEVYEEAIEELSQSQNEDENDKQNVESTREEDEEDEEEEDEALDF